MLFAIAALAFPAVTLALWVRRPRRNRKQPNDLSPTDVSPAHFSSAREAAIDPPLSGCELVPGSSLSPEVSFTYSLIALSNVNPAVSPAVDQVPAAVPVRIAS